MSGPSGAVSLHLDKQEVLECRPGARAALLSAIEGLSEEEMATLSSCPGCCEYPPVPAPKGPQEYNFPVLCILLQSLKPLVHSVTAALVELDVDPRSIELPGPDDLLP